MTFWRLGDLAAVEGISCSVYLLQMTRGRRVVKTLVLDKLAYGVKIRSSIGDARSHERSI
jgi:hypothetical protein